jgi:acyl-[acyl carrier protein]--UDP-N-acetylglucosamine O-acyltransferase
MGIHPLASVSAKARLGEGVSVGPFTVVHDNVQVGDGTVIDSHCVIGVPTPLAGGRPLVFGPGSRVRSHAVFYEGSEFGPGLDAGHRCTVREKVRAGPGLQIGINADFQGDIAFGRFVRTYNGVVISKFTTIGDFVWIFNDTMLANDPHPPSDGFTRGATVEEYAVIASMCCILPGVRIGRECFVGAHSVVTKDVEPGALVSGVPAQRRGNASDIRIRDGSGRPAYPWRRHFHRGYPEDIVARWREEFAGGDGTGESAS